MDRKQHGDFLHQLTRFRVSNCYLVEETDGLTLIDTSLRGSAPGILAAAEGMGAPVRRVVLTHAHHDHAGALEALRARLPGAEFAVGERELKLLRGDFTSGHGEPRGRLRSYLYEKALMSPDHVLQPGDQIGSLEVVDAAGHTPGHLAYLDRRDETLIAGDAYLAIGRLFVTTEFVWRFPFPALSGTWHAKTALATARRLCQLSPKRIATGHGPVIENAAQVMKVALERAEQKRAWG